MSDGSNNDFYLSQLNIDISAGLLTIPGGNDTTIITSDCDAELKCPVSFARHFLQYQTDAIDVNDLNNEDIRFRTFHISDPSGAVFGDIYDITYYNARNLLVAEAVTYNNAKTFYGSATAVINEKKVGADYARQVSEDMFGTTAGVDIFNNERAFRLDFLQKSVNAFVERLEELAPIVAFWNEDASANDDFDKHPAKEAYKQMIRNFPERFANTGLGETADTDVAYRLHAYDDSGNLIDDAETDASGTLSIWRYMPFEAGDKIYFQLRADPDGLQGDILQTDDTITVSSRTYRIRLNIVEDADAGLDDGNSTDDAYIRSWNTTGPDFSTEPAYLQTTEDLDDTIAPVYVPPADPADDPADNPDTVDPDTVTP